MSDSDSSPTASTISNADGLERHDSMPVDLSTPTTVSGSGDTYDKKALKKEKKEKKKEIESLKKEEAAQKKEEKKLRKIEKKQAEELAREEKKLRDAEKKIEKKIQKEEEKKAKEMQKKVAKETTKTRELPADNGSGAKLLRVFEGNNEYRIKFYQGTPITDLYAAVKKEANVSSTTDISLLDEDGDPVALSSHMPTGTCLYIQRAGGSTVTRSAASSTQRWTWDIVTRTCGKHVLSEDGCTLSQNYRAGYGGVRATESFSSGVHWWVVRFEPLQECVCGGVLGEDELVSAENIFLSPFGFHDAVLAGRNEGPIECGFLLDMDRRELRVYNLTHGTRKCSVKYVDVPCPAFPAIAIKHITKATLVSTAIESMPDNLVTHDDDDRLSSNLPGFESESFVSL